MEKNHFLRAVFSAALCFFVAAVLPAADDSLLSRAEGSFALELNIPESWAKIVNPKESYPGSFVSKSYKLEFNGHFGEVRLYAMKDNGIPENERASRYASCVESLRRNVFSSEPKNTLPEIFDISSEQVSYRVNATSAYRTDLIEKSACKELFKNYAYQYFFIKDGVGVVSYIFLSDDPEFFGFSDSTLSAVNPESKYFIERENPRIKFSSDEKPFSSEKISFDDLKCFSFSEQKSVLIARLPESGSFERAENRPEIGFLPLTAGFSANYGGDVLMGFYVFEVRSGDIKARDAEKDKIMEKISSYIIGYDDGMPFEKSKGNYSKKFNASSSWTKISQKCLSPCCDFGNLARIDFFYDQSAGLLCRFLAGKPSSVESALNSGECDNFAFMSISEQLAKNNSFRIVSADGKFEVRDCGEDSGVRRFSVRSAASGGEVLNGLYVDAENILSGDDVRFIKLHSDPKSSRNKQVQKFLGKKKIPSDIKSWIDSGKPYAVAEYFSFSLKNQKERSLGKYEYVKM
ncbi:MAG: hypothetical protein IJP61_06870 [Treponema sp.]|nr:hypothetical protein [Treponema sp.]